MEYPYLAVALHLAHILVLRTVLHQYQCTVFVLSFKELLHICIVILSLVFSYSTPI